VNELVVKMPLARRESRFVVVRKKRSRGAGYRRKPTRGARNYSCICAGSKDSGEMLGTQAKPSMVSTEETGSELRACSDIVP